MKHLWIALLLIPSCTGDTTSGGDAKAPVDVVPVGGFGNTCLRGIEDRLAASVPSAYIIASPSHDGYRMDIAAALASRPAKRVVLIAHSWGTNTAVAYTQSHRVKLCVLIDPVGFLGVNTLPAPNADRVLVYAKATPSNIPATTPVSGYPWKVIPNTDHGSVCFHETVLSEIAQAVKEIQ